MKQSGSNRSCPQTQSKDKPVLKCDKFDFITQNKEYFSTHMKGHEGEKIANNVNIKNLATLLKPEEDVSKEKVVTSTIQKKHLLSLR